MNITDVEDKIIENARARGVSIQDYTRRYEEAFLEDLDTLRIQRPEFVPRATEHIDEIVELIGKLKDRGLTYERDGSIYFRIGGFPAYGRLSGLELETDEAGGDSDGPVDDDEYGKENPRDFVLWKARKEGEHYWETELGDGRPGWHVECSAMSMKYLGDSFDIHCGGVDLVFPHHENEIAQSEGATEKPFVRHWVHGAHLIVEGQKMSKSLGNFLTLRELIEKGCSPLALRYLLLSVHYRKQLNFTFDGLHQAESSLQRVNDFVLKLRGVTSGQDSEGIRTAVQLAAEGFEEALANDLNTSAALAQVFSIVREGNAALEQGSVGPGNRDEILSFLSGVNEVFDVFRLEEDALEDEAVQGLIEDREQARRERDFDRADEIRKELEEKGILLEDTREGTRWKRL